MLNLSCAGSRLLNLSLAAALSIILIVDLARIHSVYAAMLGLCGWVVIHIVFAIVALVELRWLFGSRSTPVSALSIAALCFICILIFWSLADHKVISQEGAVELRCVHDLINGDAQFGFWNTCLFGYPARQSYLHALPTMLFGQSLVALNSGAMIYLLLGLLIFVGAISRLYESCINCDIALAFVLVLIFHFYFFNETSYRPNMALFPIGIAFLALGCHFRLARQRNYFNLLLFCASLIVAIHSYTPSLAIVAAALGLLLFRFIRPHNFDPIPRAAYAATLLILIAAFLRTLEYRYDVRFLPDSTATGGAGTLAALQESLRFAALGSDFMSNTAKVVFVIALVYGLSVMRSIPILYLVFLILSVFVAASITQGFGFLGVELRMHRATVAIPAVLTLILLVLLDMLKRLSTTRLARGSQLLLAAMIPLSALAGMDYRAEFFSHKLPLAHLSFIENLNRSYPNLDLKKPLRLYLGPEALPDLLSLSDTIGYFYPTSQVYFLSPSCQPEVSLDQASIEVLVLEKSSGCLDSLIKNRVCATTAAPRVFAINQYAYVVCLLDPSQENLAAAA